MVEDDFAEQAVDVHHGHLAGNLHAAVFDVDILAGLELVRVATAAHVLGVILKTFLRIRRRGDVNFRRRIHPARAPVLFHVRAPRREPGIERVVEQAADPFDEGVAGVAGAHVGTIHHHAPGRPQVHHPAHIAEKPAEKRRVHLFGAVVLGAEIIQISAVGQRVLGDEITVAPVEFLVLFRLATVRNEAVAENRVGGAKTAGVGAAEEDGVAVHFRINQRGVGRIFQQRGAELVVVAQFAGLGVGEGRSEHVVAEPEAEPVVALLALVPMREARPQRHDAEQAAA